MKMTKTEYLTLQLIKSNMKNKEYKIKYRIKPMFCYPQDLLDIVSASSAKEALEKWRKENQFPVLSIDVEIV